MSTVRTAQVSGLMRGRRSVLAAAAICAAAALALVIGGTRGRLVFLAVLAPLAVWLIRRTPSVAVGVLPAVQAADWIRVQTAAASLSPRTVFIALLALGRLRGYLDLVRERTDLRLVTAALGIWWLLSPLRASHSIFDESPLRGLVTDGSFVAVAIIGMTFGNDASALRNIARGSAAALLALGFASLLVSVGVLAEPSRTSVGRDVFGLQSPFSRNYGFDVPFDAVALLVPLCAPYYLLALLGNDTARRDRREAAAIMASLTVVFIMFFQARGMVAQLVIAAIVMSALAGRRILAVAGAAFLVFVALVAGRAILNADEISTNIRLKSNLEAISTAFQSIGNIAIGTDEGKVMNAVLSQSVLSEATAGYSIAIHNLFLSSLVTGGIVSFLALASVVGYAAVHLLRSDLTLASSKVLIVALALVVIEMNIEPLRANIIGAWLVLGLALGHAPPGTRRDEFT